jgi:hypothetical protein
MSLGPRWFQLVPKSSNGADTVVVNSLEELKVTRRPHGKSPGHGVVVFFDGQRRETRFVNPLHLASVKAHIAASSKKTFEKVPTIKAKTGLSTWNFLSEDDPNLYVFDEVCGPLGLLRGTRAGQVQRTLLPHRIYDFLRHHDEVDTALLEFYTVTFQYYPPAQGSREDEHDRFAERLFSCKEVLERAMETNDSSLLARASQETQKTLTARYGLSKTLEEDADGTKDEEAEQRGGSEDDVEASLKASEELGDGDGPDQKRTKVSSLLEDRHIRGLGSRHVALMNSYGNIITNAGNATIIGSRLPCVVISRSAARCMACWDHDIRSPEEGDLYNDDLVRMVSQGPCRDGGAWTLHLKFNEAVHIPKNLGSYAEAMKWLGLTLCTHWAKELLKRYPGGPSDADEIKDLRRVAASMSRAYLTKRKSSLQDVVLDRDLEERRHVKAFLSWARGGEGAALLCRRLVTAVQRHARTGDLVAAVRHPITQPVPHYEVMVSATKAGLDISMPPMTANLSELDYDGDKMKIAAPLSLLIRKVLEASMTVPRLMYNALGRRVVALSGVAPAVLNMAQRNGSVHFSPLGLSFSGVPYKRATDQKLHPELVDGGGCSCDANTRLQQDQVVWKGVLEPVYDPAYFFDALSATGLALPGVLSSHWSRRFFQEVPFTIHPVGSTADDPRRRQSKDTNISYDGFYPVPVDCNDVEAGRWISRAMAAHKDLFPYLDFRFSVEPHLERARPSALDGLTFQQMRSLLHVFTPKNFHEDTAAGGGRLFVPHVPGLVEKGVFCTYVRTRLSPWERMARVLLRLSWLKLPTLELGHNAIARAIAFCKKRPSHREVALGLLRAHREAKQATESAPERGILRLPNFPEALGDPEGLRDLALHAAVLRPPEAELLTRHCFDPCLPSKDLQSFLKPSSDPSVDVRLLQKLMRRCHMEHLYRLRLVEVSEDYEKSEKDSRFRTRDEDRWRYRVSVEAGRMTPEDWELLRQRAEEVGRFRAERWPALRETLEFGHNAVVRTIALHAESSRTSTPVGRDDLKSFLKPARYAPLDVAVVQTLMQRCRPKAGKDETEREPPLRLRITEVPDRDKTLTAEYPYRHPEEERWRYLVSVAPGRMSSEDWAALEAKASEIGRCRTEPWSALEWVAAEDGVDYQPSQLYTADWCRFVGALRTPPRQTMDIEQSLEILGGALEMFLSCCVRKRSSVCFMSLR